MTLYNNAELSPFAYSVTWDDLIQLNNLKTKQAGHLQEGQRKGEVCWREAEPEPG